jgi:hypothetical protein
MATYVDALGWLATALVVASFAMPDQTKLRLVNMAGCGVFMVWAFIEAVWPVMVVNGLILVIHGIRLKNVRE